MQHSTSAKYIITFKQKTNSNILLSHKALQIGTAAKLWTLQLNRIQPKQHSTVPLCTELNKIQLNTTTYKYYANCSMF